MSARLLGFGGDHGGVYTTLFNILNIAMSLEEARASYYCGRRL